MNAPLASFVAWLMSATAVQAASLFPNPVYETGNAPSAVVLGDFNSDGIADLAVANKFTNDLSILLGQGGGSFAPEFRVATRGAPTALAVGNFNRDGFQDLAVANSGSNDVTVLLGAGGGAFLPGIRLEAGVGPSAIAVSDFNSDTIEDVAVANFGGCCTSGDISIFLGDGNGGFVAQPRAMAGERPRSVAVADFNRDGLQDLAVANQFSSEVSVLLGRGDGTFAPLPRFASAFNPVSVSAGDFNGDGKPDLAVAAHLSTGVVGIFLGRGDGSFVDTSLLSVGLLTTFVAVGEFNGDGVQDLAVASFESSGLPPVVSMWLGRGDGTFRKSVDLVVGPDPAWVALGDLDGDAMEDLVVANQNSNTVSVLRGLGNGDFGPQTHFPAGSGPGSVTIGDFNEDGVRDLAVVNFGDFHASVLLGRVGDGFDPPRSLGPEFYAGLIAVGDFNGDAHQDLAITTYFRDDVSVLIGRGDGTFGPPTRYPVGGSPRSVAVGDFNEDGRQDLAVTNDFSDDLSLLLGRGDGTFQPQNRIGTGAGPSSVVVGDFDSDENQDLVVADRFSDDVAIFLGHGDGTFGTPARFQTGDYPFSVVVADFNQDGRLDLATADNGAGSVSVLMGEGDGAFATPIAFPVGRGPFAVTTGDFDANGIPDLAVANADSNDVSILLASGTGIFRRQSRFGVGDQPDLVAVSDFNSDGREDLVVSTAGSNQVWLLLNQGVTNQPPEAVIETGPQAECASPAGAPVPLDGSASTDPDSTSGTNDDIVSYEWFENFDLSSRILLGRGMILDATLSLGVHSITLWVTDKGGDTNTTTISVTVADTIPPTVECAPSVSAECTGPDGAFVNLAAIASDICSPTVVATNSRTGEGVDASGSYPLGLTGVTFTATDQAENPATCFSFVSVPDTTPPTLVVPAGFSVDATLPAGAVLTYSTSVSDVCAGAVTSVCVPASGSTFAIDPPGQFSTVNCDAADPHGNLATGGFPVHVAGASEQIENLDRLLRGLALPRSLAGSLRGDLQEALAAIGGGQPRKACGPMKEFIDTVRNASTQRKPKITAEQARPLLDAAARIRAVLGCGQKKGVTPDPSQQSGSTAGE